MQHQNNLTHIKQRYIGLDILRSIAIILAIFAHTAALFNPLIHLPIIGNFVGKTLALHEVIAYFAVEIFFVLSGFLIAGILFNLFKLNEYNTLSILKNFWLRRWLRTLPNYYLFLLVNVLIYVIIFKERTLSFKFLLFLQSFFTSPPDLYPVSWSLAVEEWFYLLFPLVLALFIKKINFKSSIFISCFIFFSFSMFMKFIRIQQLGTIINFDEDIRKVTLLRFDNLMIGILCYALYYYKKNIFIKYQNQFFILGIILLLSSILLYYSGYQHNYKNYHSNSIIRFYINYILLINYGLACALLLPKLYFIKINSNKLSYKFFQTTSQISYSMYLINLPLVKLIFFRTEKLPTTIFESPVSIIFYYSLLYLMSYLTYRFFEQPILKWRDSKIPNLY